MELNIKISKLLDKCLPPEKTDESLRMELHRDISLLCMGCDLSDQRNLISCLVSDVNNQRFPDALINKLLESTKLLQCLFVARILKEADADFEVPDDEELLGLQKEYFKAAKI